MIDVTADKAYEATQSQRQTVQALPDAKRGEGDGSYVWISPGRAMLLSPFGSRQRQRELLAYYHYPYNWMGQGAIAGQAKKVGATKWKLNGKNRVSYFQDVLRGADFGRGWNIFCEKAYIDYARYDHGAWVEVIGPGNPLRPLIGPATGLALLDPLSVYPTGDPRYPAIYYDRDGGRHLMPAGRVFQLVDAPETGDRNPGYGMCALSRAITIVSQQINMNRYVDANLDELPPPGMVVASNIQKDIRDKQFEMYEQEQARDKAPAWGKTVWFYSINPEHPAKLEIVTFSKAPENWNYKDYTHLHVNGWALALGVDVQELWQLSGGNIGSAGQSEVLHAKSQQKSFGAFLTRLERLLNDILPPSLEFQFDVKDPQAEKANADVASAWAGFTAAVASTLSTDERRRLLAATVEPYRDVVTDEHGEVVTLTDADPKDPEQTVDDAGPAPETVPQEQQTADSQKGFADTRASFISAFTDLVKSSVGGDTNRRRAGIVLRAQLNRLGRQAYADGLKAGGIEDALDAEDQAAVAAWLVEQSGYVTTFLNSLYKSGLSAAQVEQRAEMWANKSLESAYNLGLASADRNGLYEWRIGKAEKHCATCLPLNGQAHRLKEYVRRDLMPKSSKLACKGFLCDCSLVRVTGRAHGRWPVAIKEHVHALSD